MIKTDNNLEFSYTQKILDNYPYATILLRIIRQKNHPVDYEVICANKKFKAINPAYLPYKAGINCSACAGPENLKLLKIRDFLFDDNANQLTDYQEDGQKITFKKQIIDYETLQLSLIFENENFPYSQIISIHDELVYMADVQHNIIGNWQLSGNFMALTEHTNEEILQFTNGWFDLIVEDVNRPGFDVDSDDIIIKEEIEIYTKYARKLWVDHHYKISRQNGVLKIFGSIRNIDDRKRNDLYLNNLKTAFEQTSSSIVITGKNGLIQYVNRKFSDITGYSAAEVIGRNPRILKTGHTSKQQYQMLWDIVLSGKTWQGQFLNRKKNGEKYWEKAVIAPVFNDKHEITNFVAVKEDITSYKAIEKDREKIEKALKVNEEKFRSLFNLATDPIFISDLEGNLLQTNDIACQLFNINCNNAARLNLHDLFDREPINQMFGSLKQNKKKLLKEFSLCIDNRELIFEFNSSIMQTGGNEFILSIARDITERKLAEKAILESETKFRLLVENVRAIFWMLDLENLSPLYISPNFETIYGYTVKELINGNIKNFLSIVHPQDKRFVTKRLRSGLYNDIDQLEFRVINKVGKLQWMQYKSYVINTPEGKPVQVGFCEDVTERMKISHQLQEQNQELNKINQELDQFVYRVSHNLRAPLTSILGIVNLMKTMKSEADKSYYIKLIESSILKLDETIHEIIDYSKNSRIDVQSEPIDIEALVNETLDSLRYMNDKNEVEVEMDFQVDQSFYSDANRLKVIFNNLISNAFKYIDDSKTNSLIKIQVGLFNDQLKIVVRDNGIGIRKDDSPKIFNMFYRATDKSFGAGLGLAIVKEVVDKMQGTIQIDSKVYEFTEFNITLPVNLP